MGEIFNVRRLDGEVEGLSIEKSSIAEDAKGMLLLVPPFVDPFCFGEVDRYLFAKGGNLFVFEQLPAEVCLQKGQRTAAITFRKRCLVSANESDESLSKLHQEVDGIVYLAEKETFNKERVRKTLQLAAQKNWMVWLTFSRLTYGASAEQMAPSLLLEHLKLFFEQALELDSQVVYLPLATKEEMQIVEEANKNGVTVYPGVAYSHLFSTASSAALAPSSTLQKELFSIVQEGKIEFISSCAGHPDFGGEALFFAANATSVLYTAGQKNGIAFEEWIKLAYVNPEQIFGFSREKIGVLIHTGKELIVPELSYPLKGSVEYILEEQNIVPIREYSLNQ